MAGIFTFDFIIEKGEGRGSQNMKSHSKGTWSIFKQLLIICMDKLTYKSYSSLCEIPGIEPCSGTYVYEKAKNTEFSRTFEIALGNSNKCLGNLYMFYSEMSRMKESLPCFPCM